MQRLRDLALCLLMGSAKRVVKASLWLSRRLYSGVRQFGDIVLDLVYPPVCLACDGPVVSVNTLCVNCFSTLRPITAPLCLRLGLPFEIDLGPGALSAEALADPPPFGRARAAVIYNDLAAGLVSRLKYGDRPELALYCARLMAGAGYELWEGNPVLLPVPLHISRLRERRYNQSAELARALGKLTGLAVDTELIRRHRRTRQQVGLSGNSRQRNVAGAFTTHPDFLRRLKGRRIVLVDDVYTTGSTLKAVTRTLQRSGAEAVDVVSFARVVIGADLPV